MNVSKAMQDNATAHGCRDGLARSYECLRRHQRAPSDELAWAAETIQHDCPDRYRKHRELIQAYRYAFVRAALMTFRTNRCRCIQNGSPDA